MRIELNEASENDCNHLIFWCENDEERDKLNKCFLPDFREVHYTQYHQVKALICFRASIKSIDCIRIQALEDK